VFLADGAADDFLNAEQLPKSAPEVQQDGWLAQVEKKSHRLNTRMQYRPSSTCSWSATATPRLTTTQRRGAQ